MLCCSVVLWSWQPTVQFQAEAGKAVDLDDLPPPVSLGGGGGGPQSTTTAPPAPQQQEITDDELMAWAGSKLNIFL